MHDLETLFESFALDDVDVDSVNTFLHGHSLSDDEIANWDAHVAECMPTEVLDQLTPLLAHSDAAKSISAHLHSNSIRALTALLAYISLSPQFERATTACMAWLQLIPLIPQTHANFRTSTLHGTLSALRQWLERNLPRLLLAEKTGGAQNGRKQKQAPLPKKSGAALKKRRAASSSTPVVEVDDDDGNGAIDADADQDNDANDNESQVSIRDIVSIQWPLLLDLIAALESFLARFPLAPHRETAMQCATVLVELLRSEATSTLSSSTCAAVRLASAAERCLEELLDVKHGSGRDSTLVALLAPLLGTPLADGVLPPRTPSVVGSATLRARSRVVAFARLAVTRSMERDSIESAMTLVQHMCARAPDRTEYRALASDAAAELAVLLVGHSDAAALRWHTFAQRLSRQTRPSCRATAVELAMSMTRRLLQTTECVDVAALKNSASYAYLCVLTQRAADKNATVRQRALACLCSLLDASSADAIGSAAQRDVVRRALFGMPDNALLETLKRRIFDTRVNVRRCALQLAASVFALEQPLEPNTTQPTLTVGIVECLLACIDDESILVRKAAALAVSSLAVSFGESAEVRTAWCAGVLPLIADAEPSVSTASMESLSTVLLDRLCASHKADDSKHPVWELLALSLSSQMMFVERALSQLASRNQLDATALCAALRWRLTHARPYDSAAWELYAALVPHANKNSLSADFVLQQWHTVAVTTPLPLQMASAVLGALGALSTRLSKSDARALGEQLLTLLLELHPEAMFVRAVARAITRLEVEAKAAPRDWLTCVIDCTDAALAHELEGKHAEGANTDRLLGALLALGEATQRCESVSRIPNRAVTMMALLAARDDLPANIASRLTRGGVVLPRLRAHAIVALGKLCLLDVQLAGQMLGMFAKELQLPADAGDHWRASHGDSSACGIDDAVRNNVVVVLCDLCTRHTQLIDTQLPLLANLVADGNALIRRQLLQLLSDLLRENYIKWRPQLVMRVALCLADECDSVRTLATTLIEDFAALQSDHVANVFVELLFHACGCYAHPRFNRELNATEREREVFHLGDNVLGRLRVYKSFLAMMSDEAKFAMQADIVQNVLTSFVSGDECQLMLDGDEDDSCHAVLADALAVLAMPEAQLSGTALQVKETVPVDESDPATAAIADAHGRLLKRVVEKSVTEHTIPVCIALKSTLEKQRSTLLHNLMHFLVQIFKMHGSAVEDALAGNRRLARELRYDLERFEASQQQTQQPSTEPVKPVHDDDDGDDDGACNNAESAPAAQPTPKPVGAVLSVAGAAATPFRTPSRSRIAAATEQPIVPTTPMSVARIKKPAATPTAPVNALASDETATVVKPTTPWSTLRFKSAAPADSTGDLGAVATALSFDDKSSGNSNDDAFAVASTPKATRTVEKENTSKNSKRAKPLKNNK